MTADRIRIRLEPIGVEFDVSRGGSLIANLAEHGVEFPCGGVGECNGCKVRMISGSLLVTEADSAAFSSQEIAAGWRLACQARADSPLVLECGQWHMEILAGSVMNRAVHEAGGAKSGLGIAIDVGTTTIAAQLVDLATGDVLGLETMLNPQAVFGSDVMSRIGAALEGRDVTTPIRGGLGQLVDRLATNRASQVIEVVLVGNTVMHHLFSGLSVEPLAHVPFESPHLGEQRFTPHELGWDLPDNCIIRFGRCLGGFVGSDILAGIIAKGIAHGKELRALVDLGTNGEIAVGNQNGIVCASAAAGPAFEAGAIRMGMRAVTGAVAHVAVENGELQASVIGEVAPRGICGSGLVDAVAAGLRIGAINPSGRITRGDKTFPVVGPVALYQSDIRQLQLAKGAIAAGFRLLLKEIGAESSAVASIYLAGAFGNYVQIGSAIRIGLIEAPGRIVQAAGNTALLGARMMLLSGEELASQHIRHISLAADREFQDEFACSMVFPE
jgi:uncharacterized 2Fe-2S/4Fe-4S cluster protein (DUF4445 family)